MNIDRQTGPLTEEEIFNAADAIQERGQNVTQDAIRSECGDRGSTSTISKHLRNWRKLHEASNARISRELTPELTRQGLDFVAKISEHLGKRADERSLQLELAHSALLSVKEQELNDACAEADQYHANLTTQVADNTALGDRNNKLQEINEKLERHTLKLTKDIEDLTERNSAITRMAEDNEREITRLQSEIDEARSLADRFEGITCRLKEQLSEQAEQLAYSARMLGGFEESLIRSDEDLLRMNIRYKKLTQKFHGALYANRMLQESMKICLPTSKIQGLQSGA